MVALDFDLDTTTPNGRLVAMIIMAVAQWEREMIGARTKAALAVKRRQGVKLGRPRSVSDETRALIRTLRDSGLGYRAIARELASRGIATGRGGKWHHKTVQQVTEGGT